MFFAQDYNSEKGLFYKGLETMYFVSSQTQKIRCLEKKKIHAICFRLFQHIDNTRNIVSIYLCILLEVIFLKNTKVLTQKCRLGRLLNLAAKLVNAKKREKKENLKELSFFTLSFSNASRFPNSNINNVCLIFQSHIKKLFPHLPRLVKR